MGLKEPNVTVGASAGNLVMDINMDPYLNQIPATVAFLNPSNGSACALMAGQLGSGAWTQELLNSAGECDSRYLYAAPFAATVGQQCWNTLPASVESGAQYQVTFNQYQTQVEIIQKGQAPFGQAANKRQAKDVEITRAFRRDYTISVATQFRPNSAPFTLLASPPGTHICGRQCFDSPECAQDDCGLEQRSRWIPEPGRSQCAQCFEP